MPSVTAVAYGIDLYLRAIRFVIAHLLQRVGHGSVGLTPLNLSRVYTHHSPVIKAPSSRCLKSRMCVSRKHVNGEIEVFVGALHEAVNLGPHAV